MGFKFDKETIRTDVTKEELLNKKILPEDLPDEIWKIRDMVVAEKGYASYEQEQLQRYDYNMAHGITPSLPETEVVENTNKKLMVKVEHVSKVFEVEKKKQGEKSERIAYTALKDINFDLYEGDILGILGTNGSGKSTIAQLVVSNTDCTEGKIILNGDVNLVAAKVALKDYLTGEENIEYKCALMGVKKKDLPRIKDFVRDYSELGDKIYTKVRPYSSGQKARLGYSISLAVQSEIMILDEALGVGDKAFQIKCRTTMKDVMDRTKAVIFITQSPEELKAFCNKALWIERGEMVEFGEVETIRNHYALYTTYLSELSNSAKSAYVLSREEKRSVPIKRRSWRTCLSR